MAAGRAHRQRRPRGHDIRTVHEPLGHEDVKTTIICTNVLNRGPSGVHGPVHAL